VWWCAPVVPAQEAEAGRSLEPKGWGPAGQHSETMFLKMKLELKVFFLFYFFKTGSHFVAQAGLKLMIFLPQPSECWDYGVYHQAQFKTFF
jgi:hypothetical protein